MKPRRASESFWHGRCSTLRRMQRRGTNSRGFTLTELMVVIAMVSVLALLAVYGVRKYVFASKAAEPIYMIGLIKTAQEAWHEEFFAYYSPSTTIDTYYPMLTPSNKKHHWVQSGHGDYPRWRNLGVSTPNPVMFGYASVSGGPTDAVPSVGAKQQTLTFPLDGEPWYVVKAVGDQNADGNTSLFVGSRFAQEIYVENQEE